MQLRLRASTSFDRPFREGADPCRGRHRARPCRDRRSGERRRGTREACRDRTARCSRGARWGGRGSRGARQRAQGDLGVPQGTVQEGPDRRRQPAHRRPRPGSPPIPEGKELDAAVRFSAQEALPMPLESAVIDYVPVGEVETEDGPKKRVVLVAARRDMVDQILQACGIAGLRVEGLDLAAFGMARALRHADDPDQLLLSVGGLTNLAVIRGGICTFTPRHRRWHRGHGRRSRRADGAHPRSQPRLAAARRVSPLRWSRSRATATSSPRPRYVLSEGVRRLALETRQSLDFQRAQAPADAPIDHVVVTGPASRSRASRRRSSMSSGCRSCRARSTWPRTSRH